MLSSSVTIAVFRRGGAARAGVERRGESLLACSSSPHRAVLTYLATWALLVLVCLLVAPTGIPRSALHADQETRMTDRTRSGKSWETFGVPGFGKVSSGSSLLPRWRTASRLNGATWGILRRDTVVSGRGADS